MMLNIGGMLCLGASLVGSASMVSAFSMAGNLQQNLPMVRSATDGSMGHFCRHHTKAFMVNDTSSGVISKDVAIIMDVQKEDNVGEYLSQEGQGNMNLNSAASTGIVVAGSLVTLASLGIHYGVIDASATREFQEAAMKIRSDVWQSYMEVLHTSPIQTKAVTSATVYTIGDFISQRNEGTPTEEIDLPRLFRSLLAGLLGHGPLSHFWYQFSDNLFQNVLHLPNNAFGTIAKVAIDQSTWGPCWNNTYILLLGLMKLDSFGNILGEMKRTTIPLIVSGLKLWPLAHCVTYGLIPVENRLLWVDMVEIIWVTILASTAAGKGAVEGEQKVKPQN